MGKVLSIFGGTIATLIGIILLVKWITNVIIGLQFCIVVALLFGGLMAVLFGIIEIRDARELKKWSRKKRNKTAARLLFIILSGFPFASPQCVLRLAE
jgi:uncharacterized membrane protein HdeD (DUF308 family)